MRWALAFLALSSCATVPDKPNALTVEQAFQQKASLNGKLVRVEGVVRKCQRLDCVLQSSANDDLFLGIGASAQFDSEIGRVLRRRVVVEAMFNDHCIQDPVGDVIIMCADRVDTLSNPVLIWPKVK